MKVTNKRQSNPSYLTDRTMGLKDINHLMDNLNTCIDSVCKGLLVAPSRAADASFNHDLDILSESKYLLSKLKQKATNRLSVPANETAVLCSVINRNLQTIEQKFQHKDY